MIQYNTVQDRFILQTMYSKPMVQQPNNKSQLVKMAIMTGIALLASVAAIQVVNAQELLNTATNKIEFVQDMGKRDVLEEIMVELDAEASAEQKTLILVEQEDESVTLFEIDYPYEDYAETDLPMVEVGNYELMELAN